jgi:hypothetical protein
MKPMMGSPMGSPANKMMRKVKGGLGGMRGPNFLSRVMRPGGYAVGGDVVPPYQIPGTPGSQIKTTPQAFPAGLAAAMRSRQIPGRGQTLKTNWMHSGLASGRNRMWAR